MTLTPLNATFIGLLRDKGVNQVVVIDDAYDLPWPIDRGTLLGFWSEIQADREIWRLFCQFTEIEPTEPETIGESVVIKLWQYRESLEEPLRQLCDTILFASTLEKRDQLSAFARHLHEVDIELIPIGQDGIIPDDIRPPIIFIDYFMGADNDPYAVTRAKSIASGIYKKYGDAHKPLIVLMSSVPGVHQLRESFRDESGLLGGMFYFVPKDDLTNREKFFLQLGAWARNLPTGYKIQNFIDALASALPSVIDNFMKDIKKLSIEDYAYIQNLSLLEDGHPLGDYMRWLYGSYLLHLLFTREESVRTQQAEMDKLRPSSPPLSQSMPSLKLAEIYSSALFEHADDVSGHPGADPVLGDGVFVPYLHLGDLFMSDTGNRMWMVVNAECDLAMSADGRRSIPADQSILLIPGLLQPLTELAVDLKKVRTELFEHGGQSYRILWEIKNVVAVPYGNIRMWMGEARCRRIAQLKQPYALEVQRAFSADLTRIGMPVAPPFYRPVKLQLLFRTFQDRLEVLSEPLENIAFVVVTKDHKEKCVLTVDLGFLLKTEIGLKIRSLEEQADDMKNSASIRESARKYLAYLQLLNEHFEFWFLELGMLKLQGIDKDTKLTSIQDSEGRVLLSEDKLPVRIRRNVEIGSILQNQAIIIINIIETLDLPTVGEVTEAGENAPKPQKEISTN